MQSAATARREPIHDGSEQTEQRDGDAVAREERSHDTRSHPVRAAGGPFRIAVFDTIEAAEEPWRALETAAIFTPYQRYDWIKGLIDSRGLGGGRCAIAVVEDESGPCALLPLAITRRFGLSTAQIIGADIGNTGWLPMGHDAAPRFTPDLLVQLFAAVAGVAGGIDIVFLHNQPGSWEGLANPLLAFPHQQAPDHLYLAPLAADAPLRHLNSRRIRNLLRGRRRLEETMGPVVLRRAESPGEIEKVHAAFLEQRSARFAVMGIKNVFAEAWFVDFFERAATLAPGSERPALQFHALYAGDEIVATSCGTGTGTHYSQYINSTSGGPAGKYSLMGILMHDLVTELAATGVASIDMGLGDFDYKTDWTDRSDVYDTVIPLTAAGRLVAPALLALRRLKRAVKQNEKLFVMLKRLRALTLRGGGQRAQATTDPGETT